MPRAQTDEQLKRLAELRSKELSHKAKESALGRYSKVGLDRMRLMWQTGNRHK